LGQTKLS